MISYLSAKDTLIKNGYIPLPIAPRKKIPAVKGWASDTYIPPAGYGGHGVGIKCGVGPYPISGIDCDITDPDMAERICAHIEEVCGATIYRVGKAPKVMFVYRAEKEGIRKICSKHYENLGHVELWGKGQQFVCFGTHPDTGMPYTWPNLIGDVLGTPAASLPVLTLEKISRVMEFFERTAEEAGFKIRGPEKKTDTIPDYDPTDPLDRINPIGLSVGDAKKHLIPLDPDCGRDEWRNIGMALHHEFNGSPDGLAIWDEWSAKGTKYKEGEPGKQWESFGKYTGRPITAAYLLKLAKKDEPVGTEDFFSSLNWSTTRFTSETPSLPMVVEDFMPKGIVSLFYSAGGAGKSTAALYMALKIALGKEHDATVFNKVVHGGKVVIITAEDPDIIINRRFSGLILGIAKEMQLSFDEVRRVIDANLYVVSTFGHSVQLFGMTKAGNIKPTAYYSSLLNSLSAVDDLQLVIVDTKTRFSPGEGSGNVTATQEIGYYEAVCKHTGASVMLLHHSNKGSRDGSQTGITAYRDATALFDSVRAAWYLRSLKEDEMAAHNFEGSASDFLLLENSKNNYIKVNDDIVIIRKGYDYTVKQALKKMTKAEIKENKKEQAYRRVLEALQAAKGKSFIQVEVMRICSEAGIGRRLVKSALADLMEDGLVEGKGEGRSLRVSLTEYGEKYGLEIK